ncbi:hypothetical protein E3N88_37758 [Mikania micrantha]|uniref:Retrovirus-related Pol polyprotein from transposon TNT 1-94-like beta-barrel domain-containing protein n=1 Tax=Mikania micrantha TaxID=192012 RepID=A0A5N6LS31_9ASTR|nr:hypothetical protein E3N88_37758 [Mikania micrantha]
MDSEDITDVVLTGLDQSSYKPVIAAIHARDTPISFHQLHELSLIQNPSPTPPIHQPTSVFLTHSKQSPRPWQPRNPTPSYSRQPGLLPTPNPHSSSIRPFLGKCQLCFKQGHSLTSCYSFKKQYPHINLPPISRHSTSKPQAHLMAPNTTSQPHSSPHWLFDSGASHHITNDLSALSLHAPYDGTEELVIGDGSSLKITHIGSLSLTFNSHSLLLTSVLCVPLVSKNIISISQLCTDNNLLIQFFSSNFLIKESKTNQLLHHGTASHGLYHFRSISTPHAHHLAAPSPAFGITDTAIHISKLFNI